VKSPDTDWTDVKRNSMTSTGQEVSRDATGKTVTVSIQHIFKALADISIPVSIIIQIPVNTNQLTKHRLIIRLILPKRRSF